MAWGLVLLTLPFRSELYILFLAICLTFIVGLTTFASSDIFVDKWHVSTRLSVSSIVDLNRVLWSEVFVSEDLQVRAAHLILGYEPLSNDFQDIGNAIIAGDQRWRRIDVSKPGFLSPHNLLDNPSVVLYVRPIKAIPLSARPKPITVLEEPTSPCLSLEEKIEQFRLEEAEKSPKGHVVNISDKENESAEGSGIKGLIVARIDSSDEEEEEMSQKPGDKFEGSAHTKGQANYRERHFWIPTPSQSPSSTSSSGPNSSGTQPQEEKSRWVWRGGFGPKKEAEAIKSREGSSLSLLCGK